MADASRDADSINAAIEVADEAALPALAARLVAALPRPAFVALRGDLGAGKTTLVKAVAAAVGIDAAEVISPTFGLIHEHSGPQGTLLHADLYRLVGPDDLHEIGWQDALARATWAFVEWPERIAGALPDDRLDLEILIDGPTSRSLRCIGRGPRHASAARFLIAGPVPRESPAAPPTLPPPAS